MANVYRGDTWEFFIEVYDSDDNLMDLTDYQIRAELTNKIVSIKKATSNVVGGSDDEIKITGLGKFKIVFDKTETSSLNKGSYTLEVELTAPDGTRQTILRDNIFVEEDIITWEEK